MVKVIKYLSRWNKTVFQEWNCCGLTWQVILSPKTIKDRQDWAPTCPTCGKRGQPFNPEKWEGVIHEDKMDILALLSEEDRK